MSTGDLPPWPVERELTVEGYQRRLAEAAIARLRKAVEALNAVKAESRSTDALWFEGVYDKIVSEALSLIGDIPER